MSKVPSAVIAALADYIDVSTRVIIKLQTEKAAHIGDVACVSCGGPGPLFLKTGECADCKAAPVGETKSDSFAAMMRRVGQSRKKRPPALNDDSNLSPSEQARVAAMSKRKPVVVKSAREAGEELRLLQATLTPKARAEAIDAMVDAKVAAIVMPDDKSVVEKFFDDQIVQHGFNSFEAAEQAITKQARDRAPRAGSRIGR